MTARLSVQRVALACFGILGTGGLLLLAGCPADLENPQRFDVPVSAAGSNTAGSGAGSGVDTTCLTALFSKSCNISTCHLAAAHPAASLDLSSPNVAARLIDIPATHGDLADTSGCMPAKLVDTATPSASWLLLKVNGGEGTCGSQMPIGPALAAADLACVQTFVTAAAAAASSGGAAPAGSGGTSAGGGGN